MILYNLFRFFLWLMYICFYRRIYSLNYDKIPQKEPVIFISNHSNGLMDPILIAAMQWRPVYFWARASEMPDNAKGWLFKKLHGLPIYREAEGKENMHKNEITFQKTRDLLYAGNTAFIAAEGNCIVEKRLRPFKTGAARLAFKMMEEKNWEIDVKMLPSAVNYTNHVQFRSEVYVKIGDPISVQSYKKAYEEDSVAAVNQLTEDMWQALKKEMVHVEKEDEILAEKVLELVRNNIKRGIFPMYSKDDTAYQAEHKAAKYIENLDENSKKDLSDKLDAYKALLAKEGVSDYAVAERNNRSFFLLLLGIPFWVLGTISGKIPHILARNLRNKLVSIPEFATSFAFTFAFIIWMLWGLLFMIIGGFVIGWWALLLPFIMAPLQAQAYHYQDYYKEWKALFVYNKIKNKKELKDARAAIDCLNLK